MLDPIEKEQEPKIKRDLMSEFGALYYNTTEPLNMSATRQISDEIIEVELRQFPDQGVENDVTIYDELHRLQFFGWQIRLIKYTKDSTLVIQFQKVDWRSRERYGLMPTGYNDNKDIWWLKR